MAIPSVKTKDMKFKYICKYCQKEGLAWKVIDHKWILFDTVESAHVCDEKKTAIDNQLSNLKKKKVPQKKSGLKKHFDKLNEEEKAHAAKAIIKNIKAGDNALKAMADNPILTHKGNDGKPLVKGDLGFFDPGKILIHDGDKDDNNIQSTGEKLDENGIVIKTNPKSKAPKVKLIDAKELYQPVQGSSQSSTYYVVALYEGLKFAARVTGGGISRTVSIRVEGSAYAQLKGMSGLQKFKDNGAYGSIHLNVETMYEAKMVICGLIGALDMVSISPIPDLINIAT